MARILFVDDDPLTLETLKRSVELFGHEAILATSGKQAETIIADHRPDLILTDMRLPDMDGLELCRVLRKNPATMRMPVIILSARTGKEEVRQGYEAGATLYLKKPVDLDMLVEECKRVVALGKHVTRPLVDQAADADAPATGTDAPIKIPDGTNPTSDSPKGTIASLLVLPGFLYWSSMVWPDSTVNNWPKARSKFDRFSSSITNQRFCSRA